MIKHIFLFILSSFFIFNSSLAQIKEKYAINVAVSILPQKRLVEKLGGEKVKVTVMIPNGASPHTYEPRPSQLKMLSKAKMYVKVGTPVEFELRWMKKLQELNKNMLIVNMSKDVPLINIQNHNHDHNHNHNQNHKNIDPHVWLSLKNIDAQLNNILSGLLKIDKENERYYRKNYSAYKIEIEKTLKTVEDLFVKVKNKKFMVFHPSFGYFADDFNLEQIPIEVEGKNPTINRLKKFINKAKDNNIKVIFASPQFSRQTAQVVAKEIKGTVINADPLKEDYLDNFLKLARVFSEAMN